LFDLALLHRHASWFTGFAAQRKLRGCDGELLLGALKFKSVLTPFPAGMASLLVAASALSACNSSKMFGDLHPSQTLTQGYVIDQAAIDSVPVGSSREQVLLALGTPSTTATFDNEAFYNNTQTRKRYVAFDKPRIVDQHVLAVYFGPDGRVTQIANYGKKDGKVFDFISRTTPTGGKDQNFLSQVINGASKLAPGIPGGGTP
jgi:outer membrane protein assembly factor BamE (lipoprotein component of BamABCDE complex)